MKNPISDLPLIIILSSDERTCHQVKSLNGVLRVELLRLLALLVVQTKVVQRLLADEEDQNICHPV